MWCSVIRPDRVLKFQSWMNLAFQISRKFYGNRKMHLSSLIKQKTNSHKFHRKNGNSISAFGFDPSLFFEIFRKFVIIRFKVRSYRVLPLFHFPAEKLPINTYSDVHLSLTPFLDLIPLLDLLLCRVSGNGGIPRDNDRFPSAFVEIEKVESRPMTWGVKVPVSFQRFLCFHFFSRTVVSLKCLWNKSIAPNFRHW